MIPRTVGVLTHPDPDLSAPYFVEILAGLRRSLGAIRVNPPRGTPLTGLVRVAPEGKASLPAGWRRLPTVVVSGRSATAPSWDVENVVSARRLVGLLIRRGHRRIALINGKLDTANGRDRRRGFRQALRKAGIRPIPALEVEGRFDRERGRKAMKWLLNLKRPPTAVFAANDAMALGALEELRYRRCRGVAVAGFDDVPEARRAGLTTVRPPLRRLAVQAGRALRRWVQRDERPAARAIVVPARIVIRTSSMKRVVI